MTHTNTCFAAELMDRSLEEMVGNGTSVGDVLHALTDTVCFIAVMTRKPTTTKLELRDAMVRALITQFDSAFDSPYAARAHNQVMAHLENPRS